MNYILTALSLGALALGIQDLTIASATHIPTSQEWAIAHAVSSQSVAVDDQGDESDSKDATDINTTGDIN